MNRVLLFIYYIAASQQRDFRAVASSCLAVVPITAQRGHNTGTKHCIGRFPDHVHTSNVRCAFWLNLPVEPIAFTPVPPSIRFSDAISKREVFPESCTECSTRTPLAENDDSVMTCVHTHIHRASIAGPSTSIGTELLTLEKTPRNRCAVYLGKHLNKLPFQGKKR